MEVTMRAIVDADNIQIEVTNACHRTCSNCTRFCGHQKPYFMTIAQVDQALEACEGYPKMVGIMGGEPLLHPQFEEICLHALAKFPRERLGLWTCLPDGKEHYRDVICKTFGNILINDHSRDDIYHAPILVASEEVYPNKEDLFLVIDKCWLQNAWSASINPKGAFFCEIAASMSLLFGRGKGWPITKGWWKRTPKDFKEQIEEYCPKCGVALPLPRRCSQDTRDDISLSNIVRLKGRSRKVDGGQFVQSDLRMVSNPEPMAAYKDHEWRLKVARRYGIHLLINDHGYWDPILSNFKPQPRRTSLEALKESFNASNEGKVRQDIQQECIRDDTLLEAQG